MSRRLRLIKNYYALLLTHRFFPLDLGIFFSFFCECLCTHKADPLNRIESNNSHNVFPYC